MQPVVRCFDEGLEVFQRDLEVRLRVSVDIQRPELGNRLQLVQVGSLHENIPASSAPHDDDGLMVFELGSDAGHEILQSV